jgi:hypothetical protein
MARPQELFSRLKRDGEAAIDAFISDYQSENLWLDFKRSADTGAGTKLHQNDRENLAKALSGFANSDGGVIIWGVDCRVDKSGADLPGDKHPIDRPHRFTAWLENALSSCVVPAVPDVEHAVLPAQAPEAGYVVTLIPSSYSAPHQCIQPPTRLQYYMRVGSNFAPVPHAVLAGMFGRRPQPDLMALYDARPRLLEDRVLDIEFRIGLMNNGPVPAGGVYVTARVLLENPNCRVNFKPRGPELWNTDQSYGCYFNASSKSEFRLAPHIPVHPLRFQLQFAPPFVGAYVLDVSYGCESSVPRRTFAQLTPSELEQAYRQSIAVLKSSASQDDAIRTVLPWLASGATDGGAA